MKKTRVLAFVIFLVACSGPAFAGCGSNPSKLTQAQVETILPGNFACARSTTLDPPGWNERHLGSAPGGTLQEQHEGGSTVETVGTWATSTQGGNGRVTHTYSATVAPIYEIAVVADGNCNPNCTNLPQNYQFCPVGGPGAPAAPITVLVTTAAPTLAGCPSNP